MQFKEKEKASRASPAGQWVIFSLEVFKHIIKVINLTSQTNFGSNLIISLKSSLCFLQKWVAQYLLRPGLQTLNDN